MRISWFKIHHQVPCSPFSGIFHTMKNLQLVLKLALATNNFILVKCFAMADPCGSLTPNSWSWAQWNKNSCICLIKVSESASVLFESWRIFTQRYLGVLGVATWRGYLMQRPLVFKVFKLRSSMIDKWANTAYERKIFFRRFF